MKKPSNRLVFIANMQQKKQCARNFSLAAAISLSITGLISPAWADDTDGKYGGMVEEPGHTLFGKYSKQITGEWNNRLQREPSRSNPTFDTIKGLVSNSSAAIHNVRDGGLVVAPGHALFGKSYQQLTSEWSNWLQKEPPGSNPAFDPDGLSCHFNQKGKIWFLAGTFGGVADRVCKVPANKGIFFPIFAAVSFAPEFLGEPPCEVLTSEVDQIRCDINDDIPIAPNVGLEVLINGEPISDLYSYRSQSQPGGFIFESGPLFQAFGITSGDRFPAVADGYWILLKPLSPGVHTISFSADFDNDGEPDLGANYTLDVQGRHGRHGRHGRPSLED
ncbi:MAG: hypothetical protein V7629_11045 [Motiliproteus sp.]